MYKAQEAYAGRRVAVQKFSGIVGPECLFQFSHGFFCELGREHLRPSGWAGRSFCGRSVFHSCVAWAKKALHALRWQNVRPESLYTKHAPGRSAKRHAVVFQDASASSVRCMACVTPQGVRRAPKAALHGMHREGRSLVSSPTSFPIPNWTGRGQKPTLRSPLRQNRAHWLRCAGTMQRSLCCKEKRVLLSLVQRGTMLLAWRGQARRTGVR